MSPSIGKEHLDLTKRKFVYWVQERESIRYLKESGLPKPWSADPVFQSVYFCNIHREDDKVTRFIRQTFTESGKIKSAAANMVMARMINKPTTLEALGWPWLEFEDIIWRQVMEHSGVWGSAYIVSTNGAKVPKHQYVAGLLQRAFEQLNGAPLGVTLAQAHAALQAVRGLGSFMAAQVVADLKNTNEHPLQDAPDWMTFAAHGPGSLRGLSWFHNRKVTAGKFTEALVSARSWVNTNQPRLIDNMCNQDLQNCFCEFDKYMRVSMGTGRSKRKYNGA